MNKKAVVSQLRQHEKYERLIAAAKGLTAVTTAVAHPCDETSLRGALEAAQAGLIIPILVGPKTKIFDLAKMLNLDLDGLEIVDVPIARRRLKRLSSSSGSARPNCS
jgi:phosphate acetyltransferase